MGCYYKNKSHECFGAAIFRDNLGNQCCFTHFVTSSSFLQDDKVEEKKDAFIIVKPGFVNEDDDNVVLGYYDHDGDDYRFIGVIRYGDAHWILDKLNEE